MGLALEPGGRGRGCCRRQGGGVEARGEVPKAIQPSEHAVGRRNPAGGRVSAGAWRWRGCRRRQGGRVEAGVGASELV